MQVQQHGGHAKAQQTQRAGVGDLCIGGMRHKSFLQIFDFLPCNYTGKKDKKQLFFPKIPWTNGKIVLY
jgi:hypothetical protein